MSGRDILDGPAKFSGDDLAPATRSGAEVYDNMHVMMPKELESRLELEELERRPGTVVCWMGEPLLDYWVFELSRKPVLRRRWKLFGTAYCRWEEGHGKEKPVRRPVARPRTTRKGNGRLPDAIWTLLPSTMSSGSNSSLFPNHHYIDAFGDDDEYERDEDGNIIEEVEYVTLDLGVVEPTLIPSTSSYRLIVRPCIHSC